MKSVEVILGTYEKYLVGYKLVRDRSSGDYKFKQTFAEEAHNGSIKAVATSDRFLVSGGSDECIRIFDLTTHKDVGTLMQQEGTITCLAFIDNDFMISGSEDGTICVWDVCNWNCAKTLKGHKQGVCDLSVHPAGGLALSISKDKTIRTWDLVKGRCAFIHNKKEIANKVQWSPEGRHFIVLFDRRIDVYDIDVAAPVHTIMSPKQIYSSTFFNSRLLITGFDDGSIQIINIVKNKTLKSLQVHNARIKAICITEKGIITASSDGELKLLKGTNFAPKAVTNCGCRINSMALFNSFNNLVNKSNDK